MPPNGPGAQLRGTGRHRSLKHPSSMSDDTTSRLERAVPRKLERLAGLRPPHVSKDDFEPIMRSLNLQLGQVREHVRTHVREHDAFAIEL